MAGPNSSHGLWSGVQVHTVEITHQDILDMGASPAQPKRIIEAPGAGWAIAVVHMHLTQHFPTIYTEGRSFQLRYELVTSAGPLIAEANIFGTWQTNPWQSVCTPVTASYAFAETENLSVELNVNAGISGGGHASNRLIVSVAFYVAPVIGSSFG